MDWVIRSVIISYWPPYHLLWSPIHVYILYFFKGVISKEDMKYKQHSGRNFGQLVWGIGMDNRICGEAIFSRNWASLWWEVYWILEVSQAFYTIYRTFSFVMMQNFRFLKISEGKQKHLRVWCDYWHKSKYLSRILETDRCLCRVWKPKQENCSFRQSIAGRGCYSIIDSIVFVSCDLWDVCVGLLTPIPMVEYH